ncbi:MAG: outer membrane protein [Flavobacteriales bacterium]|jgi:outer membrane protein
MKKILLVLCLMVATVASTTAQKYAFIDVEYILSQMPDYTKAQKEIDDLAEKWQGEIQAAYTAIDKKIAELKQEEIVLPTEAKKKRQAEISQMQQEAQKLQQQRFGVNGDLFKTRQELIEPIQKKIYKEVKNMSDDKGYDFVLDKGKNSNILFVNPKYDKSDYIIKQLKN